MCRAEHPVMLCLRLPGHSVFSPSWSAGLFLYSVLSLFQAPVSLSRSSLLSFSLYKTIRCCNHDSTSSPAWFEFRGIWGTECLHPATPLLPAILRPWRPLRVFLNYCRVPSRWRTYYSLMKFPPNAFSYSLRSMSMSALSNIPHGNVLPMGMVL